MARVTVEDCLARVPNRFALTILASRRARMLGEGRGQALVECDNKDAVTALREVADDRVRFDENVQEIMTDFIDESRRQLRVTTGEHTFLEAASLRAMDDEEDADLVDADDVEELPVDPEAISAKAKSQTEEDATVDNDDEDDETPDADDDDDVPADLGDTDVEIDDDDDE